MIKENNTYMIKAAKNTNFPFKGHKKYSVIPDFLSECKWLKPLELRILTKLISSLSIPLDASIELSPPKYFSFIESRRSMRINASNFCKNFHVSKTTFIKAVESLEFKKFISWSRGSDKYELLPFETNPYLILSEFIEYLRIDEIKKMERWYEVATGGEVPIDEVEKLFKKLSSFSMSDLCFKIIEELKKASDNTEILNILGKARFMVLELERGDCND